MFGRIKIIIFIFLIVALLSVGATICFVLLQKPEGKIVQQKSEIVIQEKDYVQLLFVGDLMFDRGIRYYAGKNAGNNFIFNEISPFLLSNDIVIANLEGPITNNKSASSGTVPGSTNNYLFTFDLSLAKTLFEKNIRMVDLGNNHILNFGQKGLDSTEKYLDNAGISYFGAPNGPRSIIEDTNGVNVAFVGYNEFASSDVLAEQNAVINEIKKVRPKADIITVFSHWGVEYNLSQTDSQKNLAHQFVDAGADLIIGSHPHVIEPMEIYNNKRIYYSLGNFIFDQYFNEDVRKGMGVVVIIDKGTKKLKFEEKRFYLQDNGQTIEKIE